MKRVGIIGLGDMGSAMASNVLAAGFPLCGFDLSPDRLKQLENIGGKALGSAAEVGRESDTVFVMVLNGDQAKTVIFPEDGLVAGLEAGSTIVVSATIKPVEMREIAAQLAGSGIDLIDAPVSGGHAGAMAGTLTMMCAAQAQVLSENRDVLDAVGERIFHVDEAPGMGQTVKASLQCLIGSVFAATFESAVLAAKAGVDGQVLLDVFSASGAGCQVVNNALEKILDRAFVGTGSHIGTMYKDLTISMDFAREQGVPVFTTAAAMQLFQAGITAYPGEDNWAATKVLEEITGTEVKR